MNATAASALDEALAITAQMHAAALRDDWLALAALDDHRQGLISLACALPNRDAHGLALLREHNDALIALVVSGRGRVADAWQQDAHSRLALRDYERVARSQDA